MRKSEFLHRLRKKLTGLPKKETEERITFYSEMIDDKIEDGLSEERAVAEVSSVVLDEPTLDDADFSAKDNLTLTLKRKLNGTEITLLIIGLPIWLPLLIAALAVAVSLYASFIAVLISLWAVFIGLIAGIIGALMYGIFVIAIGNYITGFVLIGASFVCAGLSIFFFIVCKALTVCTPSFTKTALCGFKKLFGKKEVL